MQEHTGVALPEAESSRKRNRTHKSCKDKGVASFQQEEEHVEEQPSEATEEETLYIDLEAGLFPGQGPENGVTPVRGEYLMTPTPL